MNGLRMKARVYPLIIRAANRPLKNRGTYNAKLKSLHIKFVFRWGGRSPNFGRFSWRIEAEGLYEMNNARVLLIYRPIILK